MTVSNTIIPKIDRKPEIVGEVSTPVGIIPRVATQLNTADRMGSVMVRIGLRRMRYVVEPGLYAVGKPTEESPVFVSANYKLSFDHLRRELTGIEGWIMVIDTKGINVWCAAGKGTFGTDEITHRIEVTRLSEVVNHRQIILPQLGAPGVAAHEVRRRSSFRVIYGPVRARDIPRFLDVGMKTSPEMRRVLFNIGDRLVVVPLELIQWGRYAFFIAVGLFLLAGLNQHGYTFPGLAGGRGVLLLFLTILVTGTLVPVFLPWLPGRALSWKGMGGISDRLGNKPTFIITISFFIVSFVLIQFAQEAWLFYIFATVSGIGRGAFYTLISPMLAELFGLRSLGAILGAVFFIATIGGALGPALSGRIFDVTGSYQLSFLILLALSIIAIVLISFLRPTSNEALKKIHDELRV